MLERFDGLGTCFVRIITSIYLHGYDIILIFSSLTEIAKTSYGITVMAYNTIQARSQPENLRELSFLRAKLCMHNFLKNI